MTDDILIKEAEKDRRLYKYSYLILLVAANILWNNILQLPPIYSPLQMMLPFKDNILAVLLLAAIFSLGFAVLNTFTFGVFAFLVVVSIPLHIMPLGLIFRDPGVFTVNAVVGALIGMAAFSFSDTLWVHYGRKLGLGRTWRTFTKSLIKNARILLLPLVFLLLAISGFMKLDYVVSLTNIAALAIPVLLVLGYRELTFLATGRIKVPLGVKVIITAVSVLLALPFSIAALSYPGVEYLSGPAIVAVMPKLGPKIYSKMVR